jgi:hypothetical protein
MLARSMATTRPGLSVLERLDRRFTPPGLIAYQPCSRTHVTRCLATAKTLLLFIAVSLICQRVALAGLSGCNIPSPTTYNLGTGTDGLVPSGTASAGCEQVNEQFSNFTYSLESQAPNPSGANVNANFGGTSETGGVTATFGSGGIWTDSTPSDLCCAGSSLNFGAAVDTALGNYAVTSLSLTVNSPSLGGGGVAPGDLSQLVVYIDFCVGSATYNCNFTSPNYGELYYYLADDGGGPDQSELRLL